MDYDIKAMLKGASHSPESFNPLLFKDAAERIAELEEVIEGVQRYCETESTYDGPYGEGLANAKEGVLDIIISTARSEEGVGMQSTIGRIADATDREYIAELHRETKRRADRIAELKAQLARCAAEPYDTPIDFHGDIYLEGWRDAMKHVRGEEG